MNRNVKLMAKTNGRDTIFRKSKEELAELIVAISHLEEAQIRQDGAECLDCSLDVLAEIADVQIMCEQLIFAIGGQHIVDEIRLQKIKRQFKRFANAEI